MKKLNIILLTTGITLSMFWTACNKDEKKVTPPPPDNEVITTVTLIATNQNDANDVQTAKWFDLNPSDSVGADISKAVLNLKSNSVYDVQVKFTDETQTPAEDITQEVSERSNYHLICFDMTPNLNLTVQRTDHDTNNPPLEIGLADKFTTGNTSAGNLNVVLHHQPNIKNGDCAIGSTDADVNFTVNIN